MKLEVYLQDLTYERVHDNVGCVIGEIIFKNSMTYDEFTNILDKRYFTLSDNLQQENNQPKEELERLKQPTIFIDTQDMEERYGEELYKEYLENENHQLKDRIEKAIEYINRLISDEYGVSIMVDEYSCEYEREWKEKILKILKGEENDN